MDDLTSIPWWQKNGNDEDLMRGDYDDAGDDDILSTEQPVYAREGDFHRERRKQNQNEYEYDYEYKNQRHSKAGAIHTTAETNPRRTTGSRNERFVSEDPSANRRSDANASSTKNASTRRKQSVSRTKSGNALRGGNASLEQAPEPERPPPAKRTSSSSSARRHSGDKSDKRSSNGDKIRKQVRWICSSCTFVNARNCRVSCTKSTILTCEVCSVPYVLPAAAARSSGDVHDARSITEQQAPQHAEDRTRRNSSSSLPQANTKNDTARRQKDSQSRHSKGDNSDSTSSTGASTSKSNGNNRTYSISELVRCLGATGEDGSSSVSNLPPSLERRVQDFRFAQQKRREKHGDQKAWGIYGLYAHLSDIRADLEWAEDAAWRRRRSKPYLSWKDFDAARDKGAHSRPYFTYGVMVLCTVMMLVTLGVNGWKFEPLTVNPLIGPSSETLIACGARDTNLIVNENQWFRLFTPMVLHAGLVHYFVNMLAMYFIGGAVEKAHGAAFTSVLFVVPAVGGNILSAICLPGFISVGASGGIFGLIGGCMADICLNWNLLFLKTTTDEDSRLRHLCVLLWLAVDIIVNCILGFTPFVDNFTHLGGFLYGFCIGYASIERLATGFFGIRIGDSHWSRLKSVGLRYFGLVLSVVTIFATTIVLAQSDGLTSPCHRCRYISCVPFPFGAERDKWWHCDDCDIVTADLFVATDGSGLYQQVDIHCPNGETVEVPIWDEGIYDTEVLRRKLPSYCRGFCAEVFAH